MGTSETLRAVIEAGRAATRLDELSSARVIGKIAEQIHLAQQRAGTGKAIGPITPSGIIIDSKGIAKLGLAEPTAYAYASPEQLSGGTGDRRSDVFSLGIVMWEVLTHRSLFDAGSDTATKAAVAERAMVAPSELNANVPAELGTICMKALARNPADRYQSAKVMAAEIEAVLDDAGYGNSDEKIAAFVASIGTPAKRSGASSPPGKLATSVATAALPPPRRSGLTNSPLAVPTTSQLPSVLKQPATGPSTPAPATIPDVGVPSTAPGFAGAPGMTPVPAPPTTLSGTGGGPLPAPLDTAPTTLSGTGGGPLPAPLPPPPSQPRPSQPPIAQVPTASPTAPSRLSAHDERLPVTLPGEVPILDARSAGAATSSPKPAGAEGIAATLPTLPLQALPPPNPADAKRSPTVPPHPAGAVSLPAKGRDTELLGGWGWGTGAHPQVEDQDDLSVAVPARNPLPMIIGGGIAVVGVIVALIMVLGGEKPRPKPADSSSVASSGSNLDPHSVNAPHDAAPTDNAIDRPPHSLTGSAALPGRAGDIDGAIDATRNNVVDGSSAVGSGATTEPPTQSRDVDGPAPGTTTATSVEPPKPATQPEKAAPPEAQPNSTNEKPKNTQAVRTNPPTVQPAKPNRPPTNVQRTAPAPKKDAEGPYRQGLQMFMRGDTSGALTSLRSSLAANPNYPPAWRALGLVFEKVGDKDQARRAFRRYLQLAGGASDAEQVRNRLERLGP